MRRGKVLKIRRKGGAFGWTDEILQRFLSTKPNARLAFQYSL
jgi:hypothetical protein